MGLCVEGRDNVEHYVGKCRITIEWFMVLEKNKEEIIKKIYSEDLEGSKGKMLRKLFIIMSELTCSFSRWFLGRWWNFRFIFS